HRHCEEAKPTWQSMAAAWYSGLPRACGPRNDEGGCTCPIAMACPRHRLAATSRAMSETEPKRGGAILREFAAYLRRPHLTVPSGLRAAGAWRNWVVLVVL